MQTFLSKVAQKAIQQYGSDLGELNIVLPNRRSIVFLKNEFKKQLNTVSWLPNFFSLEDFVRQLGDYHQIDQINLIFELYEVHKQVEGKQAEPIFEFLAWGTSLIQDFNEIDRYLVDASELYGFISEAKAIEIWNLESEELTEFQHKYLKFWKSLEKYYRLFTKSLEEKNTLYQGLGFRRTAEQIDLLDTQKFECIYFAGFNALTNAEKKIIEYFVQEYSASILWDADEYYLNDHTQEAGTFLRQHSKSFKQGFDWIFKDLVEKEKEVSIFGVAGNFAQAKLIGNIIDQKNEINNNNIAVVLSDEDLLLPVLESLPKRIDKINVTMGYSLSLSPLFYWFKTYLNLFRRAGKTNLINKNLQFHHQELLSFLTNSILQYLTAEQKESIKNFLKWIENQQLLFIEKKQLESVENSLGLQLFSIKEITAEQLAENCVQLIELLVEQGANKITEVEKEYLFAFIKVFTRLKDLCLEYRNTLEIEALYQLYDQLVAKESIDFVGEPLGGLQIMGVLESRTLDFEEVIISSLNEGILPSGKSQNSFIPFDIKRKFGLPVHKEKDAIFAYHFYRILQRAKKVSLIYNTKVDQLQGGERSRFIEQLLHEMPQKNANIKISNQIISPALGKVSSVETTIPKESELIDAITKHIETGLSASAINTYLSCNLDYYYKYVLKIKESNRLSNNIEDHTFGTIVHNSLEELYLPYLGQLLNKKIIQELKTKAEAVLVEQYKKELNVLPKTGNHRLSFEVAKTFISNLIEFDAKQIEKGIELQLLDVEHSFEESFIVEIEGHEQALKLKGKIDRIDRCNGELRIIDYKTGGVSSYEMNLKDVESVLEGKKAKALQMLIYTMAYRKKQPAEKLSAGIISLRNISNGFLPLNFNEEKTNGLEILKSIITEMKSAKKALKHNEHSNYCLCCT